MSVIHRIRIYHATLAVLALLAYITGDTIDFAHTYLGYGVALIVIFRLLWALSGERQLGLMRFYPDFEGLNLSNAITHPAISKALMLGIAISIISVTLTGILLDEGKALGVESFFQTEASDTGHKAKHSENEFLEETHEFFGNLMLVFVAAHASYVLLFKFPLARFMLFLPKPQRKRNN